MLERNQEAISYMNTVRLGQTEQGSLPVANVLSKVHENLIGQAQLSTGVGDRS